MIQTYQVSTEGVLVLCAQVGLKNYYQDNAFDYDYPEGILPLINQGIALAFTTENGDEVCVQVVLNESPEVTDFQDLGTYQLEVQADDMLHFLDHATFTQICDGLQGDINQYEFDDTYSPKLMLENIPAGWYQVQAYGKPLDDFEEKQCYLEMIFSFRPITQRESVVIDDVVAI